MPSGRELAQRYAAASRKKKRRAVARGVAGPAPAESAPSGATELGEALVEPTMARDSRATSGAPRVQRNRAIARRAFADYREEYAYVPKDLRRVALVFGILLLALIILSFIVR